MIAGSNGVARRWSQLGDSQVSWINQVERWFAYLTNDLLKRSDHRSVQALEKDIREWVDEWNENPKPFIWTKTLNRSWSPRTTSTTNLNGAEH